MSAPAIAPQTPRSDKTKAINNNYALGEKPNETRAFIFLVDFGLSSNEALAYNVKREMRSLIKNLIKSFLQVTHKNWWVRINTGHPYCIYYFGPFQSFEEAQAHRDGYIKDLESEGAQPIKVSIRCRQPDALTICVEDASCY